MRNNLINNNKLSMDSKINNSKPQILNIQPQTLSKCEKNSNNNNISMDNNIVNDNNHQSITNNDNTNNKPELYINDNNEIKIKCNNNKIRINKSNINNEYHNLTCEQFVPSALPLIGKLGLNFTINTGNAKIHCDGIIEELELLTKQLMKLNENETDGIANAQIKFEFWINNNYRKICNNTKNKNNITTNKKHKIIALKSNNKYITTATDKNCGVCIIEKEWIENEIYNTLNTNQFTITGITIENTINNNKKINNEWYDTNIEKIENWINTFEIWKIKDDLKNDKLPNIYILPKIHKKYLKPRIIVNVGKNKQTSFLFFVLLHIFL
jgi:hypothetical protein